MKNKLNFLQVSDVSWISRGKEKTYEAPSDEAPHMILGYHQGRLMTYLHDHGDQQMLRFSSFLIMQAVFLTWQEAKPRASISDAFPMVIRPTFDASPMVIRSTFDANPIYLRWFQPLGLLRSFDVYLP